MLWSKEKCFCSGTHVKIQIILAFRGDKFISIACPFNYVLSLATFILQCWN